MKLNILKVIYGNNDLTGAFYICAHLKPNGRYISDYGIAKVLNIPLYTYKDILANHNGFCLNGNHYFSTKKDAENAINDLEPYLIMIKLGDIND